MSIISRKSLRDFWESHPRAKDELLACFAQARHAGWEIPADVKLRYRNATILKDGRVVFNICGNQFRLVTWINAFFTIYIRFVGTHEQYDEIDAQTI